MNEDQTRLQSKGLFEWSSEGYPASKVEEFTFKTPIQSTHTHSNPRGVYTNLEGFEKSMKSASAGLNRSLPSAPAEHQ